MSTTSPLVVLAGWAASGGTSSVSEAGRVSLSVESAVLLSVDVVCVVEVLSGWLEAVVVLFWQPQKPKIAAKRTVAIFFIGGYFT